MDTQNKAAVKPPKIPTGQELFDAIMGFIEPELTSDGVKTLDQKYKDETPAKKLERRKRYALAYERYEKAYAETMATLHAQMNRYGKESFKQVETEDRAKESIRMNALFPSLAV